MYYYLSKMKGCYRKMLKHKVKMKKTNVFGCVSGSHIAANVFELSCNLIFMEVD